MGISCSEMENEKPSKEIYMEDVVLKIETDTLQTLTEVAEFRGMDRDQLIRNILNCEVSGLKDYLICMKNGS